MSSHIKAVIFDMDGVIIDSEGYQSRAFEHVLDEEGVAPEFNEHGIVQIVGVNARDSWERLHKKHSLTPSVDELLERKRHAYQQYLDQGLPAMAGFHELLQLLKEKSMKTAIASSSKHSEIIKVVTHLGAINYFDVLVSGEHVTRGKPAPDIFLHVAKELGVNPETCLVLEDAESGVRAARVAGMKVIAVPNRFTQSHDFDQADLVVSSLEKINWKIIQNISKN